MRRLWLIFAQTVTICVAILFIVHFFAPQWLLSRSSVISIQELPPSDQRTLATDSYAEAAQRSMPAVVHIYATAQEDKDVHHPLLNDPIFQHFFGERFGRGERHPSPGLGSGVIVSPLGFILTNNHVVEDAESIEVALNDGQKFPARLVGRDPESDLAVLQVSSDGALPFLAFAANDTLRVGDVVLAIGNPFGVGQTVTMGIVSALGRSQLGINTFENYIQTDAAINPGNSGGALVDSHGNLVGINTAIYSRSGGSLGIGFAIPASLAKNIFEQIAGGGEVVRGWIGVEMQELTPELAESFGLSDAQGALIAGVLRNSPAEKGGFKPGDIMRTIDGKPVLTTKDVLETISSFPPGRSAQFDVFRKRKTVQLKVEIGRRPTPIR